MSVEVLFGSIKRIEQHEDGSVTEVEDNRHEGSSTVVIRYMQAVKMINSEQPLAEWISLLDFVAQDRRRFNPELRCETNRKQPMIYKTWYEKP